MAIDEAHSASASRSVDYEWMADCMFAFLSVAHPIMTVMSELHNVFVNVINE
jgi:hypothetical protein